jgi:hypothetical protein
VKVSTRFIRLGATDPFCEHNNEPWGFIKREEFLYHLSESLIFKKHSPYGPVPVAAWPDAWALFARARRSWVLIPLKTQMSVLVSLCCVVLSCVCRSFAAVWSLVQRRSTKRLNTLKKPSVCKAAMVLLRTLDPCRTEGRTSFRRVVSSLNVNCSDCCFAACLS